MQVLSVPTILTLLREKLRAIASVALAVGCMALMGLISATTMQTPMLNTGALSGVAGWLVLATLCGAITFADDAMMHFDDAMNSDSERALRDWAARIGLACVTLAILDLVLHAPQALASCS